MATESTNIKFSCPSCGQHLAAEPDMAGIEFDCPGCGKKVVVPASKALDNGVVIEINSNVNASQSEEVAQESVTSSDTNTVSNDNPFLKDWENAKAKAKAGGEVAKELSGKAWESSKEYGKKAAKTLGEAGDAFKAKWEEENAKNRKSNATHGEWLALKFKAIKDTLKWSRDMLYARFPLLEKICSGVKGFVCFCLASIWFVLRSIAQGIAWIVSFAIDKIFQGKKPTLKIRPAMWVWENIFLSIDAVWLNYESKRTENDNANIGFSTISIGRKIACGIVGCAIIGIIIVNSFGIESSDNYYSSYSYSSRSSHNGSSASQKSNSYKVETKRMKAGDEKILLTKHFYEADEIRAAIDSDSTSAQRTEAWQSLLKRGLDQPSGKMLYQKLPDGMVFCVGRIGELQNPPGLLGIQLGWVRSDGSYGGTLGWEFQHTISELSFFDDNVRNNKRHGTNWSAAPWLFQTSKWYEQFQREYVPGNPRAFNMLLPYSREIIESIGHLNAGSYIKSENWILGFRLTGVDGKSLSEVEYVVFPSVEIAAQIAGFGATSKIPQFETIPPRDKRDIILSKVFLHNSSLIGLANVLESLRSILPDITLGDTLKYLLESAVRKRANSFTKLIELATQEDRGLFKKELDSVISQLKSIEKRCKSSNGEAGFSEWALNEDIVFEYIDESTLLEGAPRQIDRFYKIWDAAYDVPYQYAEYIRCAWQAYPDDVSFIVSDVKSGNPHFNTVTLIPLKYGDKYQKYFSDSKIKDFDSEGRWVGDSRQDELFWMYMRERFGGGDGQQFLLRTSKSESKYLELRKGDIIRSDGWIREVGIENSVTYKNGTEKNTRKVHMDDYAGKFSRVLYTSVRTRHDISASVLRSHANDRKDDSSVIDLD